MIGKRETRMDYENTSLALQTLQLMIAVAALIVVSRRK